jgi:hypothetical protein
MAQRLVFTANFVRRNGNGGGNFSVEFVFYEREDDTHYDEHGNGQDGDNSDPAAARELSAGAFRDIHDAVDGGISFLLFVDATRWGIRGDDARGTLAAGTGLGGFHRRVRRGRRDRRIDSGKMRFDLADLGRSMLRPYASVPRSSL